MIEAVFHIEFEVSTLRIVMDEMLDVLKSIAHRLEVLVELNEVWVLNAQCIKTRQ